MIRGVNKYIIEVNNIKSDYFEKAILFVKNDTTADDKRLDTEANALIKKYNLIGKNGNIGFLRKKQIKKKKIKSIITAGIIFSLITIITIVLLRFS